MASQDNDDIPTDDSIDYDISLRGHQIEDPLAAIKIMRLEQLAVCRLKASKEMQAMEYNATNSKVKTDD